MTGTPPDEPGSRPLSPGDPRYDEDEVRRIFDLASRDGHETTAARLPSPPGQQGLSLPELQAIGREVGLAEDAVARAAAAVRNAGLPAPRRRIAGVPVGVGRTAALPGRLSDRAWELLVVDLREIFAARGRTESHGSFRQWTNGNLQILLEPTEGGHQLRMRTTSASLRDRLALAAGGAGMGTFMTLLHLFANNPDETVVPVVGALFIVVGAVLGVLAGLEAPRWAETREEQFARVAARAAELAERPREE